VLPARKGTCQEKETSTCHEARILSVPRVFNVLMLLGLLVKFVGRGARVKHQQKGLVKIHLGKATHFENVRLDEFL